mmetsp:Transcript_28401/g.75162  ORF Transcript_28401/g.75162 Transcript_28401/m.75162 type:complete len:224 (+) Transcript_28401:480-1151(+)
MPPVLQLEPAHTRVQAVRSRDDQDPLEALLGDDLLIHGAGGLLPRVGGVFRGPALCLAPWRRMGPCSVAGDEEDVLAAQVDGQQAVVDVGAPRRKAALQPLGKHGADVVLQSGVVVRRSGEGALKLPVHDEVPPRFLRPVRAPALELRDALTAVAAHILNSAQRHHQQARIEVGELDAGRMDRLGVHEGSAELCDPIAEAARESQDLHAGLRARARLSLEVLP